MFFSLSASGKPPQTLPWCSMQHMLAEITSSKLTGSKRVSIRCIRISVLETIGQDPLLRNKISLVGCDQYFSRMKGWKEER